METKDYHRSITTDVSAEEAFRKIGSLNDWWVSSFKGSTLNPNDKFSVHMGETTVDFKTMEAIPNKKVVWLVTDCYLPGFKNKTEWKDTKIVFEISTDQNQTRIDMTHVGLIPGVECYSACESGWDKYFGESLPKLLSTGQGLAR